MAATSRQRCGELRRRLSGSLPRGKNPGKCFLRLPPCRKTSFDHRLRNDIRQNRRLGREPAGKPENLRSTCGTRQLIAHITIISTDNYSILLYRAELRGGNRAAGSAALRGVNRMAGAPMSENKMPENKRIDIAYPRRPRA